MLDGSERDVMQFRATTQQRVIRELKVPEYPNAAPSCLKDDLGNSNNEVVNTKSEKILRNDRIQRFAKTIVDAIWSNSQSRN